MAVAWFGFNSLWRRQAFSAFGKLGSPHWLLRAVVCTLHAIFGTSFAWQLSGAYLLNLMAIVARLLFVLGLDNLLIGAIVVVGQ